MQVSAQPGLFYGNKVACTNIMSYIIAQNVNKQFSVTIVSGLNVCSIKGSFFTKDAGLEFHVFFVISVCIFEYVFYH